MCQLQALLELKLVLEEGFALLRLGQDVRTQLVRLGRDKLDSLVLDTFLNVKKAKCEVSTLLLVSLGLARDDR